MTRQEPRTIRGQAVPAPNHIPLPVVLAIAALLEATVVAVAWPAIGIPVALAAAAYAVIILTSPDRILRGRVLTAREHRRTALFAAITLLGLAGLGSVTVYGVELANSLEQRLRDEVDVVRTRGDLHVGQVLEECASMACAQATIVQMPTNKLVGVARFSGFALHDQRVFGWRKSAGRFETGTGSSTPPLPQQRSAR